MNYISDWSLQSGQHHPFKLAGLLFRITDITEKVRRNYTAINYFHKGGGEDEIYTLPDANDKNNRLIKDTAGCKNYCRLVKIKFHHSSFSREQIWELPTDLSSYNREGIAEYKKGSFIVNDRIHARKAVQIYVALFTIYEIG